MEADVYAYGPNAVLKLYAGTTTFAHLTTLQQFYDSLDRRVVPFALPHVYTVAQEHEFLVTIEQRLFGTPLSAVLPTLTDRQLDDVMHHYFAAQRTLARLHLPPTFSRYKLFDADGMSHRTHGDWYAFLDRYLTQKLDQVGPYLTHDVLQFDVKVQTLRAILAQPYPGDYCLIHGDFFPGNLLVNEEYHVTALLDFGMQTMYGDDLFDIATGCVFFDMYDALHANIRDRYLALLVAALGAHVRGRLYRYVLL